MNENTGCKEPHYGASAYRPDIHGILIPGRRGWLLSILYTAGRTDPHPAVLLLHGIPGCERNFDLAQALRRTGFHVLSSITADAGAAMGTTLWPMTWRMRKPRWTTFWRIALMESTRSISIYAVGHSLGGFICAHLTARRPEIKAGLLLMPCDIGRLPQIAAEDAAAGETIRQVLADSAQWLTGTSGEALCREAAANTRAFCLEGLAELLAQKPMLCIAGTLDTCTPPALHCIPLARTIRAAGGSMFQMISYPTDHFFSDYRLSVAGAVEKYLQSLIQ